MLGSIRMELAIQIQIEELPEGVFLATSDELPGLVAQGRTVAETIIALGKAFEMTTVAEGVETPEQFEMLAKLGCVPDGNDERSCLSRGTNVFCHKVMLKRADYQPRKAIP